MSKSTADTAIDFVLREAEQHSIPRLDITFFGGEPLLEKELLIHIADRFITESGDIDVHFKMSTNGTLLTEPLLQALLQRRIFISISVDGPPDLHDHQRPNAAGKGSARKTMKAIGLLLKYNPCTNVTFVITPHAASRVTESINWLFDQGFRFLTTTLDYSAPWKMSDMKTLEKSYRELAKWYAQKMKVEERFYLSCFDERIRTRTLKPLAPQERCLFGISPVFDCSRWRAVPLHTVCYNRKNTGFYDRPRPGGF